MRGLALALSKLAATCKAANLAVKSLTFWSLEETAALVAA